jgi:hypothetical protein
VRRVTLKAIGYADVRGGGQVSVKDGLCFVGHISPPEGTTILDVSDPGKPRLLSQVTLPWNTHSHKVRVHQDLMLVNHEAFPEFRVPPGFKGGLRIFDISRPEQPKEIHFLHTGGRGVHRFDFDGRYAYLSTERDGYQGNILVTVDLSDPVRPREVSRWWMPGQWIAGGETPGWEGGVRHRVHHGLRRGDRIYVSCVHAGMAIVDVTDITSPRTVARHPLHGLFTHTVLPTRGAPRAAGDYVITVDEGWWDMGGWVTSLDMSRPTAPQIIGQYDLPAGEDRGIWASHQPHEEIIDDLLFVAWFSHGLRVLDVGDPRSMTEVGSYMPEIRSEFGPLSNDVFVDRRTQRVYLVDRVRGLEILEYSG